MRNKKIWVTALIVLIICISCSYLSFSLASHQNQRYSYELTVSLIDDMSSSIERLSSSENLYTTLILLTEIKQNSHIAASLISSIELKLNTYAIGDLLGYVHSYVNTIEIEGEEINEQIITNVIDDLTQVNIMFLKANTSFHQDQDEYFGILVEELDKIIDKYPENKILNVYSNRKIR